jgi:hypothetical protein
MRRRGSWAYLVLPLIIASPALADQIRCSTSEEKTLGRMQKLCSDGTRATSYWNRTLERCEMTVEPATGASRLCPTRMHPQTKHIDVRCQ